ncbi:hypothetical protein [Burkholderia sp. Ac-20353]|uniref:hypothetical protein n=1 Tax=Burkholderia sp. Ac-20353 TaxID=2703894 RepID=UPI00197B5CD7|nr:hypothetical protein [Burkholderia sp. Ac-20353]MBN3788804.1 hypothetical protein [Burkholderia sp. Ac-20353]
MAMRLCVFDGGTNDTFGLARGSFTSFYTNTSVTQPQSTPYASDSTLPGRRYCPMRYGFRSSKWISNIRLCRRAMRALNPRWGTFITSTRTARQPMVISHSSTLPCLDLIRFHAGFWAGEQRRLIELRVRLCRVKYSDKLKTFPEDFRINHAI